MAPWIAIVIAVLRQHESELRAAGILHLRLFGSVARGDQTNASDVDLVVELGRSRIWTLFSFAGLQVHLSHLIGRTVDLATLDTLRESARKNVERENILVF